jgi:voltage-gated potassium channel
VALLVAIGVSVIVVMLESVKSVNAAYGPALRIAEWFFTILFTLEYILRLLCVRRPSHYAWSFYGVIDLLAILPSFINLFTSANYVMIIRILRLLRIFRILKLAHFLQETDTLVLALRASQRKVLVVPLRGRDGGDCDGHCACISSKAKRMASIASRAASTGAW